MRNQNRSRAESHEPAGGDALRPLFLVGCPRSGTTLLQRMLDAHPQIAIAPETHFIRRFWMRRASFRNLGDSSAFAEAIDALLACPEVIDMRLDENAFKDAATRIEHSWEALFGLLLRSFAERANATIVGEKTPNHLLYMPTLQALFPGARFVHIVRDPRAVVNSWVSVPWSTGTMEGDAAVWRRYMRKAREQPPASGTLHTIRYETLVGQPERVLRGVCSFVGVPFDGRMLTFHEQPGHTLNLEREPWKQRALAPVAEPTGREWRRTLSRAQIARIEDVVWREMLALGYLPLTARPWANLGARLVRALTQPVFGSQRSR